MPSDKEATTTFKDQLGRFIHLAKPPQRIISLVPSQTELLVDIGLEEQLVGITKFCIHPDRIFRSKTRIGGTKTVNFERLAALKPDLIIANKEENEEGQIKALMDEYPVWISDIQNLEQALDMIRQVGLICDRIKQAEQLASNIDTAFSELRKFASKAPQKTVAYAIWNEPRMLAGKETFITEMLRCCGWNNLFADRESRYPEVSLVELQETAPDLILLSSEPFPFKEKHQQTWQDELPNSRLLLVDGELFSWYGSRLLKAPSYFMELMKTANRPTS